MQPTIVFIHSLNNFTGSPHVLSVVIRGLLRRGYRAEVITSRGDGFLSEIPDVRYSYTCYRWCDSPIMTLIWLLLSQFGLFWRLLFASNRAIYYINTIVPFGAILACRLTGKRFVIHVHENMRQRKPIYVLFRWVYGWCNVKSIFVSEYLRGTALRCREGRVIYNALSEEFLRTVATFELTRQATRSTLLMVSSRRRYKGIYEFAELARLVPAYPFELVLSSTKAEVEQFKAEVGNIPNLTIYPLQTNLHPFYQRAKLLLQLSLPEACVETFGLTILEAMAYGVPAIVPPVGGPMELVEEGVDGFRVDPHAAATLQDRITQLMTNSPQYRRFSQQAQCKSQRFEQTMMINKIMEYIQ